MRKHTKPQAIDVPYQKYIILVLFILLITVVLYAGLNFLLRGNRTNNIESFTQEYQKNTPSLSITNTNIPSLSPSNKVKPTVQNTLKTCKNENLGVSLKLPNGWNCESSADFIQANSTKYSVVIGIGSGAPCNTDYQPIPNSCLATVFYTNNMIDLLTYTSTSTFQSVFGYLKIPEYQNQRIYLSIVNRTNNNQISSEPKWVDNLSTSDKNMLIQIVDSIVEE